MRRKISVCIPAYNRSALLPDLLNSIVEQQFDDYEILICEDDSPERLQIREVVRQYSVKYPQLIRLIENEKNLGYDGNMRNLVANAQGEYCLFMGNDDLMCEGSLKTVAQTIDRYPNVGVIVRSYASFDKTPDKVNQIFRYFAEERVFPAGADSISTVFRRCVVISGVVIHRDTAQQLATARFDGTLLYQVYLAARVLVERDAVFLPDILVFYRNGGVPEFGNAEAERGKFVPANRTPESSLQFMRGVLEIAAAIESDCGVQIYKKILADYANYSYPFLSIQANQPKLVFIKYWLGLIKLGFGVSILFHLYFISLLLLGSHRMDALITWIKNTLGYTPRLGSVFLGKTK